MLNRFLPSVAAFLMIIVPLCFGDQIDRETKEASISNAPKGMLVKVNPETKTVEVYRANTLTEAIMKDSANKTETEAAIAAIENPKNKVAEFKLGQGELDKESSTEAWHRRWYGHGYRWGGWGGYRPYYYNWHRPFYYNSGYFNYGGYYNYNYYRSYSYNSCHYGWYY